MRRTYHVFAEPRYYQDRAGDFLIVVGAWREEGRMTRYDGAASIMIGQASHVIGWEFSLEYVRHCRRVAADVVPAVWRQSLDRYRADAVVLS